MLPPPPTSTLFPYTTLFRSLPVFSAQRSRYASTGVSGSWRCRRCIASPRARQREASRSEEHTSELQSPCNLVCRLLLEKKKKKTHTLPTNTSTDTKQRRARH